MFPSAEVRGVAAGKPLPGVVRFDWLPAPTAAEYSVTRGMISEFGTGRFGGCLVPSQTATSHEDAGVPPAGDGYAYLIRGINWICGIGTLGAGQGGQERRNLSPDSCF